MLQRPPVGGGHGAAHVDPALASGRVAGLLMIACGLYTFVTVLLPTPFGFNTVGVVTVAVIAVAAGVLVRRLPWDRWPELARIVMAPLAMVLIAAHNWFGGVDAFRYGMFFFVIFVWLGLFERRGWSLRLTPFVVVAYVVPLLLRDASSSDLASLSYAIPLYLTVGEVLAWRSTRLRELQSTLRHLAGHDVLTGLANRALFNEALEAACREPGGVAVIFLDLDGFKRINDRLGHQAGDAVLVRVAELLGSSVRLDRGDLACRLAGDEFVVLIRDPDAPRVAREIADRLVVRLRDIEDADGWPVRASVGVASGNGMEPRLLLMAADDAMYEAKQTGGGVVDVAVAA